MVPDTSPVNSNSLGLPNSSVLLFLSKKKKKKKEKNLKKDLNLYKRKAKRFKFWSHKSPLSLKEKNKHPVLRKLH